jgi:hypothetical protein
MLHLVSRRHAGNRRKRSHPRCVSDFANRAALNQPDKLVPFSVRQPNGVLVLAYADTLTCNFDLRAMLAFSHRVNLIGSME